MFIQALNNLCSGSLTDQDLDLFKPREVLEADVPDEAIRLFTENLSVDSYNNEKITKTPGDERLVTARHTVLGKASVGMRERALQSLQNKKYTEVGGLAYTVRLKLNMKYMITTNLDVEDGLVNGSCGVLKLITFNLTANSTSVDKIWLDFGVNTAVGRKQRLLYRDFMKNNNIDLHLTPISRKSHWTTGNKNCAIQIERKQFPVVPAEALTIHKSQGQTYQSICLDLNKCKRVTRSLLYVTLSRVTSLAGLYICSRRRYYSARLGTTFKSSRAA